MDLSDYKLALANFKALIVAVDHSYYLGIVPTTICAMSAPAEHFSASRTYHLAVHRKFVVLHAYIGDHFLPVDNN
jgi:hypothetical protein